jgi:hypothetical protein
MVSNQLNAPRDKASHDEARGYSLEDCNSHLLKFSIAPALQSPRQALACMLLALFSSRQEALFYSGENNNQL